jgi:integrase
MGKRHLRLVTPATIKRTVRPTRPPNADLRTRDATMVLVAYRHGLRSSEVVDLRWEQVDLLFSSQRTGVRSTHKKGVSE